MDRVLTRDANGVRASPRFASAVMAAVRREAKVPPPIPFPWARAAPGIAAALLLVVVAVGSIAATTNAEAPPRVPAALERTVEITAKIGNSVASLSARNATIWLVVLALSAVPLFATGVLVRAERDR
jgi:hypothetical protein